MIRNAERPLEHVQRIDDREDARPVVVAGLLLDQVGQYLAVGRGLEQAALVLRYSRRRAELTMLPLWPARNRPYCDGTETAGHSRCRRLRRSYSAHGRWPYFPLSVASFASSNTSVTSPLPFDAAENSPLRRRPRYPRPPVRGAAAHAGRNSSAMQRSGTPKTPNTPHSSCNSRSLICRIAITPRFSADGQESPRKPRAPCPDRGGNGPYRVSRWWTCPTDGRCRATPRRRDDLAVRRAAELDLEVHEVDVHLGEHVPQHFVDARSHGVNQIQLVVGHGAQRYGVVVVDQRVAQFVLLVADVVNGVRRLRAPRCPDAGPSSLR